MMTFAFNTSLVPGLSLPIVTAMARDLGYDGVEVDLPRAADGDPAAGTVLSERDLVKLVFDRDGVRVVGVSAPLWFEDAAGGRDAAGTGHNALAADAMRRVIDLAERVRAPHVRLLDAAVPPGRGLADAALRLADRLVPVADHAAAAGVELLVRNALAFRTARDLWRVVEQADHPALGVAWDPLAAAVAGEPPALSVPMLNSRIRSVVLRDAALAGTGAARRTAGLRRVGAGDVDLRGLAERLRGIGFDGPVVVSYPAATAAAGDSGGSVGSPAADDLGSPTDLLRHAADQRAAWRPPPPPVRPAGAKATAAATATV